MTPTDGFTETTTGDRATRALDIERVLAEYDHDERLNPRLPDPRYRVERDGEVVRIVGPSPEIHDNAVVHFRAAAVDADALIARQLSRFRELGHAFEWKHFAHDEPRDLAARLERIGLVAQEKETVMAVPCGVELPPGPADVSIRPVTRPDELESLVRLQNAVWGGGADWLGPALEAELTAAPDELVVLQAWHGDEPVANAWVRFPRGSRFAGLYGGSTLPSHRGRGIYRALVGWRLGEARRRGYRYAVTDAGPMSRPVLARLGFTALTETTPYFSPPIRG